MDDDAFPIEEADCPHCQSSHTEYICGTAAVSTFWCRHCMTEFEVESS